MLRWALSFLFCPLLVVLSAGSAETRLAPASPVPPSRHLYTLVRCPHRSSLLQAERFLLSQPFLVQERLQPPHPAAAALSLHLSRSHKRPPGLNVPGLGPPAVRRSTPSWLRPPCWPRAPATAEAQSYQGGRGEEGLECLSLVCVLCHQPPPLRSSGQLQSSFCFLRTCGYLSGVLCVSSRLKVSLDTSPLLALTSLAVWHGTQ